MGTTSPELLFGTLAIKKGLATESEIETALDLQKQVEPSDTQPPAKVGEILLEMGTFSVEDLESLLQEQSSLREGIRPETRPVKLTLRLVQESSDPVLVNGELIAEARTLAEGDRVRMGEAVFRYEGSEPLLLQPSKPVTPTGTTVEMPAVTPKPGAAGATTPLPPAAAPEKPAGRLAALLKALAARAWDRLKRLFRDVTGKRAKEKQAALERHDLLLREIAQAALQAGLPGTEADAARKALAALQETEKKSVEKASAGQAVAAKGAAKLARDKADRALLKLGKTLAEKGPLPDADRAKADEARALEAKIKDLA
jgi:hypothetical protein